MQVTNTTAGGLGLPNGQVIPANGSAEVPDDVWADAKKNVVVAGWLNDKKLTTGAETSGDDQPTGLIAKHAGGGSWFVYDGDEKLGEAMTKEDAEAFNKLSDADKAALVKKA